MKLYEALRQALPQYDITPITEDSRADICGIFDTNHEFLVKAYGKLIDEKGVLGAILQLPDNFDPADKYIAAICENGKAIAAIDLLANSPARGELYLSFLVVHKAMQGLGIGASIVRGIAAAAGLAGFARVRLGSFDDTAEFWRKQGFEQTEKDDNFLYMHRSIHERQH